MSKFLLFRSPYKLKTLESLNYICAGWYLAALRSVLIDGE